MAWGREAPLRCPALQVMLVYDVTNRKSFAELDFWTAGGPRAELQLVRLSPNLPQAEVCSTSLSDGIDPISKITP